MPPMEAWHIPSIRKYLPDLLILDLMLPGMDGLEVCRQIRQSNKYMALPVLMLTARGEEADRVVGLELGADDYVTKPFSLRELIARVRALLRRREIFNLHTRVLQRKDLFIDPQSHLVRVNSRAIDLTALEFRLLYFLASNPGTVFSRDRLLDLVWGNERNVTPPQRRCLCSPAARETRDSRRSSGVRPDRAWSRLQIHRR